MTHERPVNRNQDRSTLDESKRADGNLRVTVESRKSTMGMNEDQMRRLREMAEQFECLIEEDFQLLADATPNTVEAWRKRGTGPAYILLGRRYLYPRSAVAEFMKLHVRKPRTALAPSEAI